MMSNRSGGYGYIKGTGYQAVELPYSGKEIAMDIVMPDAGNFTSFESSMTADKIAGIIESLKLATCGSTCRNLSSIQFQFEERIISIRHARCFHR